MSMSGVSRRDLVLPSAARNHLVQGRNNVECKLKPCNEFISFEVEIVGSNKCNISIIISVIKILNVFTQKYLFSTLNFHNS